MYAGRVACCPLVTGEYADGTDRRTPDHYITLYAVDAAIA